MGKGPKHRKSAVSTLSIKKKRKGKDNRKFGPKLTLLTALQGWVGHRKCKAAVWSPGPCLPQPAGT